MKITLFARLIGLFLFTFISFSLAAQQFTIEGYKISTDPTVDPAGPGIYAANATLPNDDIFLIKYYFFGDPEASRVETRFNDAELPIIGGSILEIEKIATLALDISEYKALSGTFDITLTSTSTERQEFMVIDSLSVAKSDQPEESSGGGGSLGLSLVFLAIFVAFLRFTKRCRF